MLYMLVVPGIIQRAKHELSYLGDMKENKCLIPLNCTIVNIAKNLAMI